jgi:hypothetical protein
MYYFIESAVCILLGKSSSPLTVAEAKAQGGSALDAVDQRLDGAPDGLHIYSPDCLFYHKYTGGDPASISNYSMIMNLTPVQEEKIGEIDARTTELICAGYTYDGKTFDTEPTAQFNWKNMFDLTNAGLMGFPVDTCTIDNEPYQFADQTAVNNFYLGGVQHIQGILASGRALKYEVLACGDIACVEAIVDPR